MDAREGSTTARLTPNAKSGGDGEERAIKALHSEGSLA
jgi:hypothetical protein